MKNIFKSLMIVVLFVGLGSSAFAQLITSANQAIDASATVMSDLTVEKVRDLSFGNVSANNSYSISSLDGTADVPYAYTIGKLEVNGAGGASVLVSWTADAFLTNSITSATMTFAPEVYGNAYTIEQFGGTKIETTGTAYILNNESTNGAVGRDYFYVGGDIDVPAGAVGTYKGTFTLTVAYN